MLQVDEYVQTLCPSLYLSEVSYPVYLDIATSQTSASFFGEQTNYAIALRACHNFSIDEQRPGGQAGLLTGKTEGRTSESYWNNIPKGDNSGLTLTTYGQRLKALIASMGCSASIGVPGGVTL